MLSHSQYSVRWRHSTKRALPVDLVRELHEGPREPLMEVLTELLVALGQAVGKLQFGWNPPGAPVVDELLNGPDVHIGALLRCARILCAHRVKE